VSGRRQFDHGHRHEIRCASGQDCQGGKARANGMAFRSDHQVFIVANSTTHRRFLILISRAGPPFVAKIEVPGGPENWTRSAYHARAPVLHVPPGCGSPTRPRAPRPDRPKSGKLVNCTRSKVATP